MNKGLLFLFVLAMFGLGGCAAGQKIAHTYTPEGGEIPGLFSYSVSIRVVDDRPYVASGRKEECFIGIYRGGFGNTFDVKNEGNIPLAHALKRDLATDLAIAGFSIVEGEAERQIVVYIVDYNFDCMINCRVWHKITVQIIDSTGTVLHAQAVDAQQVVNGSYLVGPKPAMEKAIPEIYAKMIRKIVRDSPEAIAALRRSEEMPQTVPQ